MCLGCGYISIHAPREGGDGFGHYQYGWYIISIHAPREGGDDLFAKAVTQLFYFNPRPPRGGRRDVVVVDTIDLQISIHAPREGGDAIDTGNRLHNRRFQSTPPARGAT